MIDQAFAIAELASWAQSHGIFEIRSALAFASAAANEVSDSDGLVAALVAEEARIQTEPTQVLEPISAPKGLTAPAEQATAKEAKPEKEKP